MKCRFISRGFLCAAMVIQAPAGMSAQVPVPRPRMSITVVEGDAAIHNVRQRKPVNVVVVVRDAGHRPIRGASVTFTVPDKGSGAVFGNRLHSYTAETDKDGYAIARGIRPNEIPGPFRIGVKARSGEESATAEITHFNMNVTQSKGKAGKIAALMAVMAAAAGGGTAYALRKQTPAAATAAPAPPPSISLTPGAGVVGPPR